MLYKDLEETEREDMCKQFKANYYENVDVALLGRVFKTINPEVKYDDVENEWCVTDAYRERFENLMNKKIEGK